MGPLPFCLATDIIKHMSYLAEILNSKPNDVWVYNASDNNIRTNAPTTTGTTVLNTSVVAGGTATRIVGTSIQYPSAITIASSTQLPFSMEVWARVGTTGPQRFLVGDTDTSWLYYENGLIKFTVPFGSSSITLSAPTTIEKYSHVVGTYSKESVDLFVDGRLVASETPTAEQIKSGFSVAQSGVLRSLAGSAVQAVAVYPSVLSAVEVLSHNIVGKDVGYQPTAFNGMGGLFIDTSVTPTDTVINFSAATTGWLGRKDGCHVETNFLEADQDINGVKIAGSYEFVMPFIGGETISIVQIMYEGYGVVVTYSTDGSTWTPIDNFGAVPGLGPEIDDTDLLIFRVVFPAGTDARLYNFHVLCFKPRRVESQVGLTLTDPVTHGLDYNSNQIRKSGLILNGGSITIGTTEEPIPFTVKTVQAMVYFDTTVGLATNFPTTGVFINGSSSLPSDLNGKWQMLHWTDSGGSPGPIGISFSGQIANIVIYDRVLTTDEIANTFKVVTGSVVYTVNESLGMTLDDDVVSTYLSN